MARRMAPRNRASLGLIGALGVGALTAAAGVGGSDLIRSGALSPMKAGPPPGPRLRVEEIDAEDLVLGQPEGALGDLDSTLLLGLEGRAGYGQLEGAPERSGRSVRRRYVHRSGARPVPGDELLGDMGAFQDARQAVGTDGMSLAVHTEVGPIRTLHIPGGRDEWAILVHGRIATPQRELLRMARAFVRRGHPVLLASYRNAAGAPLAPRGVSRFGIDEWADIAAAVALARANGATSVLIGGISMGGAIAVATADRLAGDHVVSGLVLDSPVLDLSRAIAAGAQRSVPGGPIVRRFILSSARPLARWRFGTDWRALDYVGRADALAVPTLVFHGASDRIAPVSASDELAALRPDLVTYQRATGVDHVRSWNADPLAYEEAIWRFLERVAP